MRIYNPTTEHASKPNAASRADGRAKPCGRGTKEWGTLWHTSTNKGLTNKSTRILGFLLFEPSTFPHFWLKHAINTQFTPRAPWTVCDTEPHGETCRTSCCSNFTAKLSRVPTINTKNNPHRILFKRSTLSLLHHCTHPSAGSHLTGHVRELGYAVRF